MSRSSSSSSRVTGAEVSMFESGGVDEDADV